MKAGKSQCGVSPRRSSLQPGQELCEAEEGRLGAIKEGDTTTQ